MDGFLSSSGVEPAAAQSSASPSFHDRDAYQKFMSAPACLVPPETVEAIAAAAAAAAKGSSAKSNGGAGGGGQFPETCSFADVPGASSPRSLQVSPFTDAPLWSGSCVVCVVDACAYATPSSTAEKVSCSLMWSLQFFAIAIFVDFFTLFFGEKQALCFRVCLYLSDGSSCVSL